MQRWGPTVSRNEGSGWRTNRKHVNVLTKEQNGTRLTDRKRVDCSRSAVPDSSSPVVVRMFSLELSGSQVLEPWLRRTVEWSRVMEQVEVFGWLVRLRVDDVLYLPCKYATLKVVTMIVWIYNLAISLAR
jgi:hypothetical protein